MELSAALLCLVLAVTDGDTLKVQCPEEKVTVRLADIDAPEKKQDWGPEAQKALAALCEHETAQILGMQRDRYGRLLGKVYCKGQDVQSILVAEGMAWVYRGYSGNLDLLILQIEAQETARGLWATSTPHPPWEWRKMKKQENRLKKQKTAVPQPSAQSIP